MPKLAEKPFHFIQTRKRCWWLEEFPPLVSGVFAIPQSLQGKSSSLYEENDDRLLQANLGSVAFHLCGVAKVEKRWSQGGVAKVETASGHVNAAEQLPPGSHRLQV